jgi:hypothetical protein
MKKTILIAAFLTFCLVGCNDIVTYPSITGQIKQIISPVTVPGYDILYSTVVFTDGRSYIFRGQCPTILEEGKSFKIFYNTHSNQSDYHYAVFKDVQKINYEPTPPPIRDPE